VYSRLAYTQKEWIKLPARDRQISVEGLAKLKGIKPGVRIALDSSMIGTSSKEGVVTGIKVNSAYDSEENTADDIKTNYPNLRDNLTIVVQTDDDIVLEVNYSELTKIYRR
jgi:hypothetical protein